MDEPKRPSDEPVEALVARAFARSFHFAFRRPTPRRPKTRLLVMPPAQHLFAPRPDEDRQLYETLLARAQVVVQYLMGYESMVDLPRHWQVHHGPSPRRNSFYR